MWEFDELMLLPEGARRRAIEDELRQLDQERKGFLHAYACPLQPAASIDTSPLVLIVGAGREP